MFTMIKKLCFINPISHLGVDSFASLLLSIKRVYASVEAWCLINSSRVSSSLWLKRSHFSSVARLCPALCDSMDCSMPGFPVHHQLPEIAQTQVHQVGDAIQPSHLLLPHSPHSLNLPQHQGLFQWVSSLHQVAKVLEFQHQSFQWIFRVDFL